MREWGEIPIYACSLDSVMGSGALAGLDAEAARHMPAFNANARRLYDNWMRVVRGVGIS